MKIGEDGLIWLMALDIMRIEFCVVESMCSVCTSTSKRLNDKNNFLVLFLFRLILKKLDSEKFKWFLLLGFCIQPSLAIL